MGERTVRKPLTEFSSTGAMVRLSCIDPHIPRHAQNEAPPTEAASLSLGASHEKCGAVSATLEAVEHHAQPAEGKIPKLVAAITPAIHHVQGKPGDELDNGVRENISLVVEQLKRANPVLTKALKEGRLKIVGARYDLHSGAVDVITQ